MEINQNCRCQTPPLFYGNYMVCFIGTDMTDCRYGEVSIEKCIHCNSKWLKYFVEYEGFSKSGRWFMCLINNDDIDTITPENSVDYLDKADWYIYGGSYYESSGKIGSGKINIDLNNRR